ncbi:hypothetical protein ACFL6D_02435 [Spirochaetota bacterium]
MVRKLLPCLLMLAGLFPAPIFIQEIKDTSYTYTSLLSTNEICTHDFITISNHIKRKYNIAGKPVRITLDDGCTGYFSSNRLSSLHIETDSRGNAVTTVNVGGREGSFYISVFFLSHKDNFIEHSVFHKIRVINPNRIISFIVFMFFIILSTVAASVMYHKKDRSSYYISLMFVPFLSQFSKYIKNYKFFIYFLCLTIITCCTVLISFSGLYIYPQLLTLFILTVLSVFFYNIRKIDIAFFKVFIFQILIIIFIEKYGESVFLRSIAETNLFLCLFIVYLILLPSIPYNIPLIFSFYLNDLMSGILALILTFITLLVYCTSYYVSYWRKNRKGRKRKT